MKSILENQRTIATVSGLAMLCSCASGQKTEPALENPAQAQASYEFSATVSFTDNVARESRTFELTGVMVRLGDSLFVHPKVRCQALAPETPSYRLPKGMPMGANFVSTYCQGVYLSFNRTKPSSARWYTWHSRPETREVCEEMGTRNGRQVCIRSDMKTFYNTETRSGPIKVTQLGQS